MIGKYKKTVHHTIKTKREIGKKSWSIEGKSSRTPISLIKVPESNKKRKKER